MELRPSDVRRAAALIIHHGAENGEGVVHIFNEAAEEKRGAHLLLSVLNVYDHILPELRSDLAQEFLRQYVLALATSEDA